MARPALILGDSQTLHTGKELELLLRGAGYQVVRDVNSGKNTRYILEKALKKYPDGGAFSEVFLLTGGNDVPPMPAELAQLVRHFSSSGKVFYLPLPPATVSSTAKNPTWLFPKTAASREKRAAIYRATAAAAGAEVIDYRRAPLTGAVVQPSGVRYPNQRDGFHTSGASAKQMARYVFERSRPTPWGLYVGAAGVVLLAGLLVAYAARREGT